MCLQMIPLLHSFTKHRLIVMLQGRKEKLSCSSQLDTMTRSINPSRRWVCVMVCNVEGTRRNRGCASVLSGNDDDNYFMIITVTPPVIIKEVKFN